jgi:hypothetical protein
MYCIYQNFTYKIIREFTFKGVLKVEIINEKNKHQFVVDATQISKI